MNKKSLQIYPIIQYSEQWICRFFVNKIEICQKISLEFARYYGVSFDVLQRFIHRNK
jgi:hypothetical protein